MTSKEIKVGTKVLQDGYVGTVTAICDWDAGLVEVRFPGGMACMAKSGLRTVEEYPLRFADLCHATHDRLTDELAAAGWDSTQRNRVEAREAVARLFLETRNLWLYDSETNGILDSDPTDEQAIDSSRTPEGHILVDGRRCYVGE